MALRFLVMLIVFALVLPPLTDAFGIRTLCAFLAHGQEDDVIVNRAESGPAANS
jgi:hypothetical protein